MRSFARVAVAVALCVIVTTPGGRAQAPAPLRVSALPTDVGGQAYYAADQGFFKDAGLAVELETLSNGPAVAAAIAAGTLDVGSSNALSLAVAHERGLAFVMIAAAGAYSGKSPTAGFVVLRSSPLRSAKDFLGKTVAVATLGSLGQIALAAWLDRNGVDIKLLKIIEMPYSAMDAALTAGRVDGTVMEDPILDKVLANDGRLFAPVYDAIARDFIEGGFFVTADFAKAHPDVIRKFRTAIARTARWANANHAATAKILEKYSGVPVSDLQHRMTYPSRLDAAQMQPLINAAAKYGLLKAAFPAGDLFAPS